MQPRALHHKPPHPCSGAPCSTFIRPPHLTGHVACPAGYLCDAVPALANSVSIFARRLLTECCCTRGVGRCAINMPDASLRSCSLQWACAHVCRFGAQFKVPMPDMRARRDILKLILSNHELEMPYSVDPALLEVRLPGLTPRLSSAPQSTALLCDVCTCRFGSSDK